LPTGGGRAAWIGQFHEPASGAGGSVVTIASRAPSRAPCRTEIQSLKTKPKSMIPNRNTARIGRMMAISTKAAPRSRSTTSSRRADRVSEGQRSLLCLQERMLGGVGAELDGPVVSGQRFGSAAGLGQEIGP